MLFLLEAHPSILSGSSDTGCGASGEAADEKASMRALICAAVPALAFASLTPQHLIYMSQLAVLNHSWWLAACEFKNKPLPVFSPGTSLEGYWLIFLLCKYGLFLLKPATNLGMGSSVGWPVCRRGLSVHKRWRDWRRALPVCDALRSDMSCHSQRTGNCLQFSGFSGIEKAASVHWEGAEMETEAAHVMS